MGDTKDIRKGRGRLKSVERGQAVDRATDLYWREGCHTLSLNEVCQRISISKPALYREFGGEDGLVEAVLADIETDGCILDGSDVYCQVIITTLHRTGSFILQ